MQRTLYKELVKWKTSPHRQPLILEGARHVGKTWLLKEFGRNEYRNVAYINCEGNPDVAGLFTDLNPDSLIRKISAICDCPIYENDTLIILDEIETVARGLTSLKYFCEDKPDIHIAVANSFPGICYHCGGSFPVGKVDFMRLYPMTFNEFLSALGKDNLLESLLTKDWACQASLKNLLTDLLRQYFYVGGMPEVVHEYVQTGYIHGVREIQKAILAFYDSDFKTYGGKDFKALAEVWNSIHKHLFKKNKKFIYGDVRKGIRTYDDDYYDLAIQWLKDAGLIYFVERNKKPEIPLSFYVDNGAFKVYMLDIGLLAAMAGIPAKQILLDNSIFTDYNGAFAENYVIQQLSSTFDATYYYYSKDNSSQEVDFLFQNDDIIVPVEVKAEENVKAKSLSTFIREDYAQRHFKGIRFSMKKYIDQGWMENIPLWSAASWGMHLDEKLQQAYGTYENLIKNKSEE